MRPRGPRTSAAGPGDRVLLTDGAAGVRDAWSAGREASEPLPPDLGDGRGRCARSPKAAGSRSSPTARSTACTCACFVGRGRRQPDDLRRAPADRGRHARSRTLRNALGAARAVRDRARGAARRGSRCAPPSARSPSSPTTAEHVASTRDLTRRIDAHGDDEVARLATAFNTMLEALEHSQRAQKQLVADASHELRTPLTSLRTNLEVLARGGPPDAGDRERLREDLVLQLEELTGARRRPHRARPRRGARDRGRALDALVAAAVERARRHAPRDHVRDRARADARQRRPRAARPRRRQPARQRRQVQPGGQRRRRARCATAS